MGSLLALFVLASTLPAAAQPALLLDPEERMVFHHAPLPPAEELESLGRPNEDFDARHYDLQLTVDPAAHTLEGTATLTVECLATTGILEVDLVGLDVDQVTVGGQAASFVQTGTGLEVDGSFSTGDVLDVAITYGGVPELAHDSLGFNFTPAVAFTFTEPDGSAYWFPCFDDPSDKATVRLAITAPDDLQVAGNGLKTGESMLPGGWKQTVWEHDYLTAPYLVAVAISDYVVLEDEVDGLPLIHWVYPHREEEAAADFAMHRDMVPMYEEIFGIDYPFDKYGAAMVPMGGAMEHQTCTAMGEGLVDGYGTYGLVFAHELAHHWWGNLVTCATWDDIWLNEGFATYSEALAVEYIYGEDYYTQYVEGLAEAYIAWNEWEGVFPLSDPDYMWGGTVYDKGGVVVHMLRMRMGDDAFSDAILDYADRYEFAAATTDDLQDLLQEHTEVDLELFFDQWVHQAGHPEFALGVRTTEFDAGTVQVDVGVEQRQSWDGMWQVSLPILLGGDAAPLDLLIDEEHELFSFCRDEAPSGYEVDPEYEVLKVLNVIPISDWDFTDVCSGTGDDDATGDDDSTGDDDTGGDGGIYLIEGEDCSCSAAPRPVVAPLLSGLAILALAMRRRDR